MPLKAKTISTLIALLLQTGVHATEAASASGQAPDLGAVLEQRRAAREAESGKQSNFSILSLGARMATFRFEGWGMVDGKRVGIRQTYTVDAGIGGDPRHAVVWKEIEIIRKYFPAEVFWNSTRIGHTVKLSTKPEDKVRLEQFLFDEQFGQQPPAAK